MKNRKRTTNKTVVVHFGKYHGFKVEDIPSDYLKWLAESVKNKRLSLAADREFNFRDKYDCHFYKE